MIRPGDEIEFRYSSKSMQGIVVDKSTFRVCPESSTILVHSSGELFQLSLFDGEYKVLKSLKDSDRVTNLRKAEAEYIRVLRKSPVWAEKLRNGFRFGWDKAEVA